MTGDGGDHRSGPSGPTSEERRTRLVCAVAAGAQLVTLAVTWPLWRERTDPANLPVVEAFAGVPWGAPLAGAAILALWRPRVGGPAFLTLYGLAVLGDQVRIQPEVLSLGLLMTLPAFGPSGRAVSRWLLAATWLWAGLNKALSLGWPTVGAAFIADAYDRPGARVAIAWLVPLGEIALGLGAMVPRAWRATAVGAVALHVGILVTLSPLFAGVNASVWAWNAALAIVAVLLFWVPRPEPMLATTPVRLAALGLLATPLLFYGGAIDAYLSHHLYTYDTPTAVRCEPDGGCRTETFDTFGSLDVAFPPEARLYRAAFLADCVAGSSLDVTGIRTRLTGDPEVTRSECESPTRPAPERPDAP